MSRRSSDGQLFVGRLSKDVRTRELEDIFEVYGRLIRCDIKYGAEMAYAFVDFEDRRDAEDAIKYENGRDIRGSSIIVEYAKGSPRRPVVSQEQGNDECYRCFRPGHWARDCPSERYNRSSRRSPRRSYRSRSRERRRRTRSRSRDRSRRSRSRSDSRDRRRSSKSSERQLSRSPVNRDRSRSASYDRN